ncbi:MAG TPA: hypothetical protein PKI94_00010 [Candidatus Gastranaerophilaceae bacterium]|nr:hypothetical protein [Candidatus Gastranaerophilaceae bacterium]
MKIIFTICSNNYLAKAKALGDSLLRHNSDYKFIICLCDIKHPDIDYSFFEPYRVIEAHNLEIEKFEQMCNKYNIIELNTSIKPFVFDYLFKNYKDVEYIMYFDPDTYVFDNLATIEKELMESSILLTPHIYKPIEFDGKTPVENDFTQHGTYNLGFLALKRSEDVYEILDWWKRRLEVNCYIKPTKGIFVDQLPMNFAPIFFNRVKVSENWGLNVAPWNLHERTLTLKGDKYFINDKYHLIFYHFSDYNFNKADVLSENYTRVSFEDNDVLKRLYEGYKKEILNNKFSELSKIKCVYANDKLRSSSNNIRTIILKIFKYIKKDPLFFLRKTFWL